MDPVFGLCGISTEVIVTKAFGEARESLLTRDLSGIDGVVVIGGDGTFGDIAQGLLERTQLDAGLELREGRMEASEEEGTMGQNQVILRHQKFTFPRARE